MDGIESVFVLEDDADFSPEFGPAMLDFLGRVPADWTGIMPGGQHHAPPEPVKDCPGVVRVRYAQRTHAYIARGEYLKGLQARWGNGTVHIDWMMKAWQYKHLVYAPERWIVGQGGGRSDIRGNEKPPEWWNDPDGSEPVVLLRAPREVMEALRLRGLHAGFSRDEKTGFDVEIGKCFIPASPAPRRARLAAWIRSIQQECVGGSFLCTVWHPKAQTEDVQAAWHRGPVVEVRADTADEAWSQIPPEWRATLDKSQAIRFPPVVLLEAPRTVMEGLRTLGFHAGDWRDDRGYDRELCRIFSEEVPVEDRAGELVEWFRVLDGEARHNGKVVTVWHPGATEDVVVAAIGPRRLLRIEANTVDEALSQWRAS